MVFDQHLFQSEYPDNQESREEYYFSLTIVFFTKYTYQIRVINSVKRVVEAAQIAQYLGIKIKFKHILTKHAKRRTLNKLL